MAKAQRVKSELILFITHLLLQSRVDAVPHLLSVDDSAAHRQRRKPRGRGGAGSPPCSWRAGPSSFVTPVHEETWLRDGGVPRVGVLGHVMDHDRFVMVNDGSWGERPAGATGEPTSDLSRPRREVRGLSARSAGPNPQLPRSFEAVPPSFLPHVNGLRPSSRERGQPLFLFFACGSVDSCLVFAVLNAPSRSVFVAARSASLSVFEAAASADFIASC